MVYYTKFDNGLRLVVNKMDGMFSVSSGVFVGTGSANETKAENGISHFIEHTMFKGTKKRSAFEISDYIDRTGGQINAFTSKTMTCYYTKSIKEHALETLEVLSDIFFNSVFDPNELEKEKGVIIEEVNMGEDTPDELCLDLLCESYYGKRCLGQTIIGPKENIKAFTREDIRSYMDKYYNADNVVISIAGNVEPDKAKQAVEELFVKNFKNRKSYKQKVQKATTPQHLYKYKKIEQSHIGIAMKGLPVGDPRTDILAISNIILGGGMSSRLFQTIREKLGLAYSVYSYTSQYKSTGNVEIYAGVNTEQRDEALAAIVNEVKNFRDNGVTEEEFLRGKEQLKSSFIMGQESTPAQMLFFAKNMLMLNRQFSLEERMKAIDSITIDDVNSTIKDFYDIEHAGTSTVGPKRKPLSI